MKYISLSIFFFLFLPIKSVLSQRISIDAYIREHKASAIYFMETYGIPASVILGIAIHESAAGNSKVARYLNNHFGIKGANKSTKLKSAYKGYNSVHESYADFVGLLQRQNRYKSLFSLEVMDYEKWVKGIARAGYAMSSTWTQQVLDIIAQHKLNRWDTGSYTSSEHVYQVRKGDTLYEIARRFGTSVQALIKSNGLKNNVLQIGQHLKL